MLKRIHKLDFILLIGIALIALGSAFIDVFHFVVFPICCCVSVSYVSYPFLIILMIYSSIKYKDKEEQDKPTLVKWFMFFLLPFIHVVFVAIGLIIAAMLKNILQL